MILGKILFFLAFVAGTLTIDKKQPKPVPTPEADTIALSGQVRYRPAAGSLDARRTPRYELVLSELGSARLYSNGRDDQWVQMLGQWSRVGDTLQVYDCKLLIERGKLKDPTKCLLDAVPEWKATPPVMGW